MRLVLTASPYGVWTFPARYWYRNAGWICLRLGIRSSVHSRMAFMAPSWLEVFWFSWIRSHCGRRRWAMTSGSKDRPSFQVVWTRAPCSKGFTNVPLNHSCHDPPGKRMRSSEAAAWASRAPDRPPAASAPSAAACSRKRRRAGSGEDMDVLIASPVAIPASAAGFRGPAAGRRRQHGASTLYPGQLPAILRRTRHQDKAHCRQAPPRRPLGHGLNVEQDHGRTAGPCTMDIDARRPAGVAFLVVLVPSKESVFWPHVREPDRHPGLRDLVATEDRLRGVLIAVLRAHHIEVLD